jgi:hypothetical protein
VGIRFRNVTVPRNAAILAAWVRFQVDETSQGTTSLTIRGQLAVNAQPFTTADGNVSSRPRTQAFKTWPVPPWPTVGQAQQTVDIANVIAEIVNQGTWSSGNPLALIITGTGSRIAEAYDGVPAAAPLLHIEYRTGP